jgi:cellulose synthase operon protein YhjQ
MQRVVIDATTASGHLAKQIMHVATCVLVPIVPDLNSVVSLTTVDNFFRQQTGADGRPVAPFYLLNQFDASLPLHLDVREVLRQQLGDRLLPTVVRRSPAVSEALAEGMTVVDYAPNSPVTEDYLNIAAWLRNVSAPAAASFRGSRWSER